jgi:hypothetical protein
LLPQQKPGQASKVRHAVPFKLVEMAKVQSEIAFQQLPKWLQQLFNQMRLRRHCQRFVTNKSGFGLNLELTNRISIAPAAIDTVKGKIMPLSIRAIRRTIWHELGHSVDSLPIIASALFSLDPQERRLVRQRYPNVLKYLPDENKNYPALGKINAYHQNAKYPERFTEHPDLIRAYQQDRQQLRRRYKKPHHPDLDEGVSRDELFAIAYSQAYPHPKIAVNPQEEYEEAWENIALQAYPKTTKQIRHFFSSISFNAKALSKSQ